MAWFNEVKGHGYIWTEAGERLFVSTQGFAGGNAPIGRCAGLVVDFDVAPGADGRGRQAVESVIVEEEAPRRARRHRSGG
jgi:cold shock CspA family protein